MLPPAEAPASPERRLNKQCKPPGLPQVLWPKDAFLGGNRGCQDGGDARLLRSLVHAQYGIPLPAPGTPLPRIITLQRKSSNRRLLNELVVVQMLAEFGEVRGQPSPSPANRLCCWPCLYPPRALTPTPAPIPPGARGRVWR